MRLATLAVALLLGGCAAAVPVTPLPSLAVRAPGPDVPPEIARFSGTWVGTWTGNTDGTLVVEEIRGREAVVINSWGANPGNAPGYQRVTGTFGNDNVLRFGLSNGARLTFTMGGLGTLNGTYAVSAGTYAGVFRRASQ